MLSFTTALEDTFNPVHDVGLIDQWEKIRGADDRVRCVIGDVGLREIEAADVDGDAPLAGVVDEVGCLVAALVDQIEKMPVELASC